jgi:hypothetical protein
MRSIRWSLALALALGVAACGDDDGQASNNTNENQNANQNQNTQLNQTAELSECGGFFDGTQQKSPLGDPETYCDAELLLWSYDAGTRTVSFANNRATLNCCGDHAMVVTVEDGTFVLTETDAPEGGTGRCDCLCVFDYTVAVDPVEEGEIPVRLVRNVTDGEGPVTLWEGTIDLADGSGSVTLDASETVWCNPPQALSVQPQISDCGGFFSQPSSKSPLGDPETYCEAEVLWWSYTADSQTLNVADNRATLNCCGDHSVLAAMDGTTLEVVEIDAPEGGSGRCNCLCVYDYTVTVSPIPSGVLPVRLLRNVTDAMAAPVLVWEGTFDLGLGNGSVTLDASETMWCTPPAE